jgi:hypothetical protein
MADQFLRYSILRFSTGSKLPVLHDIQIITVFCSVLKTCNVNVDSRGRILSI